MTRVLLAVLAVLAVYVPAEAASWPDVLTRVRRSVVRLEFFDEERARYQTMCSGVVVGSQDVLTVEHCLSQPGLIVTVERHPFSVEEKVGTLVRLRTIGRSNTWRALPIRRHAVRTGDAIATIGYGLGGDQLLITAGHVATTTLANSIFDDITGRLILNMELIVGQSGGAVVDSRGRLVSLADFVLTDMPGRVYNTLGHSPAQADLLKVAR
jgi:S1-C subfamily serine protease